MADYVILKMFECSKQSVRVHLAFVTPDTVHEIVKCYTEKKQTVNWINFISSYKIKTNLE